MMIEKSSVMTDNFYKNGIVTKTMMDQYWGRDKIYFSIIFLPQK